jgi:hypothetical protein
MTAIGNVGGRCLVHQKDMVSLDISSIYQMDIKSQSLSSKSSISPWYIHCHCPPAAAISLPKGQVAIDSTAMNNQSSSAAATSTTTTSDGILLVANTTKHAYKTTTSKVPLRNRRIIPSIPTGFFHVDSTCVTIPSSTVGAVVGTRWYHIGGFDHPDPTNRVVYYDSVINQWIDVTPLPVRVAKAASCVYDGQIYVMVSVPQWAHTNTFVMYPWML